ncbi:hypothetical protein AWM75_03135 [Aerococcus urinaehominis]|uniref:phosphoserine phosphatase n=1 Tax=Aerococcus urinaehominis TaxID=128944 RepID=A0A109RHS2_9LACT|nr:HAD family hydrolase [Aerococcus urinaehominis]AMB99055.1 hypothetical protein AWM75_03135 [Aerococcus urinaehominis]SDM50238.1 haloacid dehalogenase-like hydrolase [Aerococcus urinaehominis]
MKTYFPQENWEDFAYQRLNQLITDYQQDPQAPLAEQNYVVFDFDNTSAINDIEDHLMMYMLDHLSYKLTPAEFAAILRSWPQLDDYHHPLIKGQDQVTLANLIDDILDSYQVVYDTYIIKDEASLDQVKAGPHYQTFAAKLRLFYNLVNGQLNRQPGQAWPNYWFAGFSREEFRHLGQAAIQAGLASKVSNRILVSHPDLPGKTDQVKASFESGLRFPNELANLYQAFQDHGIATYIVSASPYDLVRVAADHPNYQVPAQQTIGMSYQLDDQDRIVACMDKDAPITKGPGKTQAIRDQIMPHHQGKQPLALFGDSMGDYHMMTALDQVKLNVIFNRYQDNATQDLIQAAIDQYGQDQARFVVQGRDENAGCLRASQATIPLGHHQSVLKAADFKAERSLSE